MKRFLASLLGALIAGAVLAQAPFTIVRPADGSKVRETVHILFPKNSIPDGGYVGIFVNGNFVEATMPRAGQKFLDYALDTKALNLPDGPLNIEAVLYVSFEEKPRIVDRSSIAVTLSNKANISVPADGFKLRYHWQPGREWIYKWDLDMSYMTISEAQARMGGRAAEVPVETHTARLIYAMDNVYSDGDALLRLQPAPPAGKTSVVLPIENDPTPRRFFDYQMASAYMRVHPTGQEVYGQIPPYVTFEGQTTPQPLEQLYADYPLPMLPTKNVKPGDTWQTRFQLTNIKDPNNVNERDSLTEKLPARGEFVGVEWEMGYPCAKIRNTLTVGTGGGGVGVNKIQNNAQSIEETFWYALDKGVVVKMIRTMVIDKEMNPGQPTTGPQTNTNTVNAGPRRRGRFGQGASGDIIIPMFGQGKLGAGGGEYGNAPGQQQGGVQGNNPTAAGPTQGGGQLYRITYTSMATFQK